MVDVARISSLFWEGRNKFMLIFQAHKDSEKENDLKDITTQNHEPAPKNLRIVKTKDYLRFLKKNPKIVQGNTQEFKDLIK